MVAGPTAALLSAIPNSWAAFSTFQNSKHAKRTGVHRLQAALDESAADAGFSRLAHYCRWMLKHSISRAGDMYWHLLAPQAGMPVNCRSAIVKNDRLSDAKSGLLGADVFHTVLLYALRFSGMMVNLVCHYVMQLRQWAWVYLL